LVAINRVKMSIDQEEKRAEFPQPVKKIAKERAGFICSNPDCRLMTIGPSESDENQVIFMGQVAHILPAKKNGPRDIPNFDPDERSNIENAIYLCGTCAGMIDKNKGSDFPVEKLKGWREEHHIWMRQNINKQLSAMPFTLNVQNNGNTVYGVQNVNYIKPVEPQIENQSISHDKIIFERLMALCDEDRTVYILNRIKNSHRILSSEQDLLEDVSEFLKKASNTFLDPDLTQATSVFTGQLVGLNQMIGDHFDVYPYHQKNTDYTIELEPRAFHWTGIQVEADEKKEGRRLSGVLIELCNEVGESLRSFRMEIKRKLFI
jgi:hypothetical protein